MREEPAVASAGGKGSRPWLLYAMITTGSWGIWGAFIEIPEKAGFPATLGYSVWALTMIPCALVALRVAGWRLDVDTRAVVLGSIIGLTGAGGQLILFEALRTGPAFIVFPVVSLYPALTIVLSVWLLTERAPLRNWVGIALALPAIALLSYVEPGDELIKGYNWLLLAVGVFAMWGVQAYVMKFANQRMMAESIFFYMMATGLLLVPVAVAMTDFSPSINWGLRGPYLAAVVHSLNSIGALCLVYAVRYGKAIIVVPMTALAPVITIVLSLVLYRRVPYAYQVGGMIFATLAIYLMAE
ncbi:MAG: EamA family transporter [Acidobacteriota bacterium]